MPKSVLPDTDVMVDFLRGHTKAVDFVKRHSSTIVLSSIVIAELYAGVRDDQEIAILDEFVAFCRVAPVTVKIARIGGIYKRDYSKSHGIGLADAIVAATAQAEEADLKTLNVKHYPMFKGLRPPYLKK